MLSEESKATTNGIHNKSIYTISKKGNKKSLATATSEQADVDTPEATSGTAFVNSISITGKKDNRSNKYDHRVKKDN